MRRRTNPEPLHQYIASQIQHVPISTYSGRCLLGRKARDDDPSDPPKGMFDDILSPEDRDTAETSILPADKHRFEKSRLAADVSCVSVLPAC